MAATTVNDERLRRWRLVLGGDVDGTGCPLRGDDRGMDDALAALYHGGGERGSGERHLRGGLGGSTPKVARWLGDIRRYFPKSVVQLMQKDALERLDLRLMLTQPELLEAVQPDVHLVADLLPLSSILPAETKETARLVVRTVVEELERRLANPLRQAVLGALNRASRNRRPRHNEIDWNPTIRANPQHYQPDYNTIIPETRIGYSRKRHALREIVLCVDQSGSMASSVVFSSVFVAVLASLPALKTSVVVFDTAVVDLTADLSDQVDVLFGTQLGGGTDIHRALTYCQGLIRKPQDTILVLISDLCEGGDKAGLFRVLSALVAAGVQVVGLLALSDDGAPWYDRNNAHQMAALGVPVFGCTPDLFPELMAAAITRQDLKQWAATHDIVASRGDEPGGPP